MHLFLGGSVGDSVVAQLRTLPGHLCKPWVGDKWAFFCDVEGHLRQIRYMKAHMEVECLSIP